MTSRKYSEFQATKNCQNVVFERDAQTELVEQDAEVDDDDEVKRVLDVRLQLSHDDDEDAHEDAQVDPLV